VKRIVLVEDNDDSRMLLRVLLEDTYSIDEYCDGSSACEGLVRVKPDLILMDIFLPNIDGEGVLGFIRRNERLRDVPVAALTAHAMPGDREKYLSMGFDEYISKPVLDIAAFRQLIGELFTRRSPAADAHER
jgi:CheY-like chemotaxis protein